MSASIYHLMYYEFQTLNGQHYVHCSLHIVNLQSSNNNPPPYLFIYLYLMHKNLLQFFIYLFTTMLDIVH